MKFGIATRIGVLAFTLVLVTAVTVGVTIYTGGNRVLTQHELESLGEELHLQGAQIVSKVETLRDDIKFLSRTPPIQGIIRARTAGGVDPLDGSTEALWRQRLATIFTKFLESKSVYLRARYIGVADRGREIVRVGRSGNTVVTVAGEDLHARGETTYFQEATKLGPDEVYISDVNLNREQGAITEPHVPVLRLAAPVYSLEGEVFGIVVINMDFRSVMEKLSYKRYSYYYVTNDAGDFLAHPDPALSFGFELGERHRIEETFSELSAMFEPGNHEGEMVHFMSEDHNQGVCFLKVAFDPLHPERFIGLAQAAPYEVVLAETIAMRNRSLMLTVLLMAGFIVLALFLARRLTRPLDQITRATEHFARGEFDGSLPVNARGEIGVLARAFHDMIQQVAERDRALQESEARVQTILDTAPDGMITIGERGVIESFNQAAQHLFGYDAAEVIGQNVKLLMPSPEREEHDGYLADYLNTGVKKIIGMGREVVGQRKDGTSVPLDLIVNEVRLDGRRLFTGIVRDITERKKAKAENSRLAAFPRENPNPVLESDADGNVIYTNPGAQRVLDQLGIEQIAGLLPVNHTQIVQNCLEHGQTVHGIEASVQDRVFSWSYHSVSPRDVVHHYAVDVTERKQAEAAQRKSGEQLQGVMEHLPNGVCLLDNERNLVLMNPVAQEYLEALMDGAVGEVISRIGEHEIEEVLKPREDGLAHEVIVEGPPQRIFEVDGRPVTMGAAGGGWVLLVREVTREREIQERAQRQDRLASVGQLAAGIAHDFNNMLTVMMGFAQMLEMRPDIPDAVKGDLKEIFVQGQRAAQLIRQILDFSRKTVVERQSMDLIPFLKESVKLLERTLPETIQIATELGSEAHVVNANLTQMQQVMTNLAVNARDAMPEGGELRIELSHLRLVPGERQPSPGMVPGYWTVWTVADTGTGMLPEVLEHAFEPFFTTKRPGEGTGLGLAQIYGIVKQHGGHIDIESEVGKGTAFTIYLPQVTEAAASVEEEMEEIREGSGETILIVEDEESVREMLTAMLERLNYHVMTATNGREALEVYNAHGKEIALILTDLVMPEMGGIELLNALKEKDAQVRMVVMTGYPLGEEGEFQLPRDIHGSLEKPLNLEHVARVVGKAMNGNA